MFVLPSKCRFTLIALLLVLSTSGCNSLHRRMTIRSNPPGAKVYVDDQEIGVTPVSTYYTYYADRKITLVKDGYRTETVYQKFLPPWYELPPLDFVAENFSPREIRDERSYDFQLVPQEIVAPAELISRAENLRNNAKQGTVTPLLPRDGKRPPDPVVPGPTISRPGEGLPENAPLPYVPSLGPTALPPAGP